MKYELYLTEVVWVLELGVISLCAFDLCYFQLSYNEHVL